MEEGNWEDEEGETYRGTRWRVLVRCAGANQRSCGEDGSLSPQPTPARTHPGKISQRIRNFFFNGMPGSDAAGGNWQETRKLMQ